jgi:GMP synthase-like glutamine amidotransferase
VKPVLVVQHAASEGPAALGAVLRDAGCELTIVRSDLEPIPTQLDDYAALLVLGGIMSATSDDGFPARRAELALLEAALEVSMPTLGVCLGAQLLAAAAGGTVYRGPEVEIGWRPVTLTDTAETDRLLCDIGNPVDVFQWHGDTFDLPPDAVRLGASEMYENQAFRVGEAAWGLQFHVEIDEPTIEAWLTASPGEAERAPGGPAAIRSDTTTHAAQRRRVQEQVGTRFAQAARKVARP